METTYEIRGYIVGDIWMPCTECYKPIKLMFVRDEADRPNPWVDAYETLRDALLKITNDGDFRSCQVADATLWITRTEHTQTGTRTHTRVRKLSNFPSIADMVKLDWDGPAYEE